MAWDGYYTYDGAEFINVARVETYARQMGLHWLRPRFSNDSLPAMLGDVEYLTPLTDDAPWVDADETASLEFAGVVPIDINGIEDSTRSSVVVEATSDGGSTGRLRHTTKAVVFNVALIGTSEAGVEYGLRWLKNLLLGQPCGPLVGQGSDLCYLSSEPVLELLPPEQTYYGGTPEGTGEDTIDGGDPGTIFGDVTELPTPEECMTPYVRTLREVMVNVGPTVTAKRNTSDGACVWVVTFTAVAANPFEYGPEIEIVRGMCDPTVEDPYVIPEGGYYDTQGYIYTEEDCAPTLALPVYDPLCPAITAPPAPPSVPLGCYTPPVNWLRRTFTIPKDYVGLWGTVVPKVAVHAQDTDIRNLRLRFYADVLGTGDIESDPCAYCGDVLISYVPVNSSLIFDASQRIVYVEGVGGSRRHAESLVFKTDGTPFDWPELTCGFGYVVTLDLPQTQVPPSVDLSLQAKVM